MTPQHCFASTDRSTPAGTVVPPARAAPMPLAAAVALVLTIALALALATAPSVALSEPALQARHGPPVIDSLLALAHRAYGAARAVFRGDEPPGYGSLLLSLVLFGAYQSVAHRRRRGAN